MTFTINTNDQKVDNFISEELSVIVNELTSTLSEYIQCILITGGFGRGEGGVYQERGTLKACNDYDILVIIDSLKAINEEDLREFDEIASKLAEQLSVKQVDIALLEGWKLAVPYPSVARYEIKHGHQILWGKLPYKIRCFPSSWIPIAEGTTYFRSRMSGLLIAKLLFLGSGQFSEKLRYEYANIEIIKAYLVLGDTVLIRNKSYHYSYQKRKDLINTFHGQFDNNIFQLYLNAIDEKLMPKKLTENKKIEEKWDELVPIYINKFLEYESVRLKTIFKKTIDYYQYFEDINKKANRNLLAQFISKENKISVIRSRIECLQLLERNMLTGSGKYNDTLYQETLSFLKNWHPRGIIEQM